MAVAPTSSAISKIRSEMFFEETRREAVDQLVQHVDDGDAAVQSSVVCGVSHEAIKEYVAENDIDVIVMASEGESKVGARSLGSVTDHILRTGDVPC